MSWHQRENAMINHGTKELRPPNIYQIAVFTGREMGAFSRFPLFIVTRHTPPENPDPTL
jgi:hypothetical protein